MAVSRAERRAERAPRVRAGFGADAEAALDLFELMELAYHDCYGEITPPERLVAAVLDRAGGDLATLVTLVRAAVTDPRDLLH